MNGVIILPQKGHYLRNSLPVRLRCQACFGFFAELTISCTMTLVAKFHYSILAALSLLIFRKEGNFYYYTLQCHMLQFHNQANVQRAKYLKG